MFEAINVYLRSRYYEGIEYVKVRRRYYNDRLFRSIDQHLSMIDPFHISKEYLRAQSASNVYQYGETPLTTLEHIAKTFGIGKEKTLIDMGCGRGRGSFFLARFMQCNVIGIERIPLFIDYALQVLMRYPLPNLQFIRGNMLEYDAYQVDYLYMYQTMLAESAIKQFLETIKALNKPPQIITVSYPLSEYDSAFIIKGHLYGEYLFGQTDVYLNQRRNA